MAQEHTLPVTSGALYILEEGMASKPRHGIQVAVYGKDKRYHHVCGDRFDRKTRSWVWDEGDLQKAIMMIH